ncbi:MAG: hypothetical protein ACI4MN_06060 [Candidatus Coproplasma sp.]
MKILKLNLAGVSLYEDSLPHDKKDDLVIKLEGVPTYNALFYFVGYSNTKEVKRQRISYQNSTVTIPSEDLTAGKFGCRIEQWSPDKARQQKVFTCEELGINDGSDYCEDPSIAAIRKKVEEIDNGYKAADKEISNALSEKVDTKELEKVKAFCAALYDFAKEAVRKIPYISDYKFSEDITND